MVGGCDPSTGNTSYLKNLRNTVYKIDLDLKQTTLTKSLKISRATRAVFMPKESAIILGGNDTKNIFNVEI